MESPASDLMQVNENGSCLHACDRTRPWHGEGKLNVVI